MLPFHLCDNVSREADTSYDAIFCLNLIYLAIGCQLRALISAALVAAIFAKLIMYILAFDTNFTQCSVAITHNGILVAHQRTDQPFMHAENLVSMIEQALSSIYINYQQLSYLAITKGPGSFTGIRTGLAVAEALCFALPHLKPITFSSFEVLEYAAHKKVANFHHNIVIFRATAETAYLQLFDPQGQPLANPLNLRIEAIPTYLQEFSGLGICSGNMIKELYEMLKEQNIIFLPYIKHPKAKIIAALAYRRINSNNIDSDLTPLYVAQPSTRLT